MTYGVEQGRGPVTRPPLRTPHVLLDHREVEEAVRYVSQHPAFVFDIETTKQGARSNELRWVGIGVAGRNFLIPCRHPKGWMVTPAHKEKTPACLFYPPGDPRRLTSTGKESFRLVEHTMPAVYAEPPRQLWPHQVAEIIEPLLYGDRAKIGHNVKFDLMSMAKYYDHVIPPGPYHDTIILTHVVNENLTSYKLKDLTMDWLRISGKRRQSFYPNLGEKGVENFGLDEVARYLAKDLRYAWLRWKRWYPLLVKRGVQVVYDTEMALYPVIMDIEYAGFPVDTSVLDTVREDLDTRLAEIEQHVHSEADGIFPLSNTAAKRWVLFGRGKPEFGTDIGGKPRRRLLKSQKLKPLSFTAVEKLPQVTQAVLDHYADRNEMASLLLEWSQYDKLRGTFVEGLGGLLRYNGDDSYPTIHTSLKQHGTVTGRFSCAEPNLQQIPRGSTIRQMFVAGPGHVLIVADYDQIELRCAGYESGDRNMRRVFLRGEDVHRQAAAAMFDITLDAVTDEQRAVGKTQNFAVLYGAKEDKIAKVARCTKKRALELIEGYYELFSELEPWKVRVLRQARANGDRADASKPPYVEIPPWGRRRRLPDLFRFLEQDQGLKERAERQAINALVQGFAANITKLAMMRLAPELAGYPAQMILQVHDEIIVRVREDVVDDVMPVVEAAMSGVLNPSGAPILGDIPLIVSVKAGYTWAAAKGK